MIITKYRCRDCDEIFDSDEAGTSHELIGEFWGAPAYNDYVACPRCGSTDLERNPEEDEDDNDDSI